MKIGILTFTDGTNYGQRLQNYALQNVLETMGNEVYTFEQVYKPSIKHIIKEMIVQFVHPQRAKQEKKRIEEFNRFNKQYIKFYERKLKLPEKKQWVDENFDLFLAGSDQIWNPYSPFVNENFFLTFASTDKRFSYAASFSVDNIPEDKYEQYVEWISGFQQISVREIRAQELINKMTGKKPELVIDPVLLLDKEQWKKITKPLSVNFPQKYIFSLFLGTGYQEEELIIEQQTGLKIIRMSDFYTLAPDEMLTLLENAALVLTDSYHITVFSIIFGNLGGAV